MSFWKEALSSLFWYICREYPVDLNFCILALFYINGRQALYVNPDIIKCISVINLSTTNKNVFTISFILWSSNKIGPTKLILLKGVFIPRLLNYPVASCSSINVGFLLQPMVDFDKSMILLFFIFTTFGNLLSEVFLHLKEYDSIKIFAELFKSSNF